MLDLNIRGIISGESEDFAEVAPQEAEGAVIESEFEEEAAELQEENEALEEATSDEDELVDDVTQLEEVEEIVGNELSDPESEGLSQVAAENISILIHGIRRRSGFTANGLDSITGETFGASAGNRRMKTEVVYESVTDAVKSGWNKVVEVVKSIINYLKEFWKKHISTIGRLRKAIEKAKRAVRDVKGYSNDKDDMKAPASLQKAFYTYSTINASAITEMATNHLEAMKDSISGIEGCGVLATATSHYLLSLSEGQVHEKSSAPKLETVKWLPFSVGTEEKPLIDGVFGGVKSTTVDGSPESATIEVYWDQRKSKASKEVMWEVSSGEDVYNALSRVGELLEITQRFGKVVDNATNEFNRSVREVQKAFNKMNKSSDDASNEEKTNNSKRRRLQNQQIKFWRNIVSTVPKLSSKITGLNIKLARHSLTYTRMVLGTYKDEE